MTRKNQHRTVQHPKTADTIRKLDTNEPVPPGTRRRDNGTWDAAQVSNRRSDRTSKISSRFPPFSKFGFRRFLDGPSERTRKMRPYDRHDRHRVQRALYRDGRPTPPAPPVGC